jgi:hypothetical protein
MTIVAGFDVYRAQITFDALDQEAGQGPSRPHQAHPRRCGAGSAASRASESRWRWLARAGCSCARR